jgi:hypothetical protein
MALSRSAQVALFHNLSLIVELAVEPGEELGHRV